MLKKISALLFSAFLTTGCMNIEDVPLAHKGMVYEKSDFGNTRGLIGDVLNSGSHDLGWNNDYYLVQCAESSVKETFTSPAQDGVEFKSDLYVLFKPDCNNPETVKWILSNVQPNPSLVEREEEDQNKSEKKEDGKKDGEAPVNNSTVTQTYEYRKRTVTSYQLFATYVRSSLGNAVRDAIAAYPSNEVNNSRAEIAAKIEQGFLKQFKTADEANKRPNLLQIDKITLSRIIFPESMMALNTQYANKKTEAAIEAEELKRVKEQTATEEERRKLAAVRSQKDATEIAVIGKALRENPEYLTYLRIQADKETLPKMAEGIGKTTGTIIFGSGQGMQLLPVPTNSDKK